MASGVRGAGSAVAAGFSQAEEFVILCLLSVLLFSRFLQLLKTTLFFLSGD